MKLQELSTPKKSEQLSQIVESFFGKKLNVTALTVEQATSMLTKTQNLIKEVTNSTKFHSSEKNPAYLQALIIEQSLQAYLNEYGADQKNPYPEPIDTKQLTQGVQKTAAAFGAKPAALIKGLTASSQGQPMGSQEKAALGQLSGSIGKALADPNKAQKLKQLVMNDKRSVMESEVTTAQVVLAAQDMVDRIQKMYEEVAEMQYKDLPSLATSMKEELGISISESQFSFYNRNEISEDSDYPGIKSFHIGYEFLVVLDETQYLEEGYIERQKDKDVYFVWRPVSRVISEAAFYNALSLL